MKSLDIVINGAQVVEDDLKIFYDDKQITISDVASNVITHDKLIKYVKEAGITNLELMGHQSMELRDIVEEYNFNLNFLKSAKNATKWIENKYGNRSKGEGAILGFFGFLISGVAQMYLSTFTSYQSPLEIGCSVSLGIGIAIGIASELYMAHNDRIKSYSDVINPIESAAQKVAVYEKVLKNLAYLNIPKTKANPE